MKDFKALGAKAAVEDNKDMTKASKGGGDYAPPAAGFCLLRLAGYFEIGKQKGTYLGKPTLKDMVQIVFEVSGPKHPPHVAEDGTKTPIRITIEENYSLNEKAKFFKLFQRMNYKGEAQHMVQMMGEAFKANLLHRKYAKRGEDRSKPETWTGCAVELWDKTQATWTIEPPRVPMMDENGMPTGEERVLPVTPLLTTPKAFLWNHSDLDDWNSLFIDGQYDEKKNEKGEVIMAAKSKNVIQNIIKQAANFSASPIYALIAAAGGNLDIPDAETADVAGDDADDTPVVPAQAAVPQGADADDALNAVV